MCTDIIPNRYCTFLSPDGVRLFSILADAHESQTLIRLLSTLVVEVWKGQTWAGSHNEFWREQHFLCKIRWHLISCGSFNLLTRHLAANKQGRDVNTVSRYSSCEHRVIITYARGSTGASVLRQIEADSNQSEIDLHAFLWEKPSAFSLCAWL